jgi:DNA helicase II / ATP-dependent DNA helicase PcrA
VARRFTLQRDPERQPGATFQIDYRAALNEAQHAAATAGEGPVLIVAGAGTGKTRTLTYRVAYLIESGAAPEQILLLTFTRRAAREMLGRAAGLLDGRCERVRGGTFHAVCLHILRRHAERISYPRNFTILDSSDAADVLDLLRTAAGLHRSAKRFPKKNTLQAALSAAASRATPLAEIVASEYPQFVEHLDAMSDLARQFAAYKREHGMMDYDDLLARTVELLETDPAAHRLVASANRHVLVDEYQDTNRVQARLVELFASVHGNVTAVGDDAQSIYRFRGADLRNILRFPETFPGTRVLKLEHNYRSTQPILDVANAVLQQARDRFDKTLFTDRKTGEKPALVPAPDTRWQSRFVSQMILQLREEGVPLNRMAVLFRSSHNAFDLESELDRYRIPYVKYGGLKLTEAAHIRDILAHLRVAENPGDAVSWMRILKLIEGVGPKTAQRLIDRLLPRPDPFAVEAPSPGASYADGFARLAQLLTALRESPAGAGAQVARVLDYYRPILERVYADDHPRRAQDLDAFLSVAEGHGTRATLLEALALDPIDLTANDLEATYQDEAPLVLSTIHSAKGLEFDTVFLIDALEGVLPSQYAVRNREELDEELRLLYVALTRAERLLFVCYPMVQYRRGAGDYFASPSRFVESVPPALFEPWVLEEPPAGEDRPSLPAGGEQRQLPPADDLPF